MSTNEKYRGDARTRGDCRLCGSIDLVEVLSFGNTPPANAYLSSADLDKLEISAPLVVNMCNACKLVQLRDVVDPEILFGNYLYVSGTSPVFVAHFARYAKEIVSRFGLSDKSLVVDVGSNDGTLLQQFKNEGMRVLGIDPAENLAREATEHGIPTIAAFLSIDTARRVVTEHGKSSVITANNTFGHIDDVRGAVEGIKELLAPEGVFVFEIQYLKDQIEQNIFDNVYHEHQCYFHLMPLVPFFDSLGLRVFDAEHIQTHGGSLRIYVGWKNGPHATSPRVEATIKDEAFLNDPATYTAFAHRVTEAREKLRALLAPLLAQGKRIVGYGAPAKATTFCYAFGITKDTLEYIIDDAILKQGRYMPGTHIPIKAPTALYEDKPDYCLILAWNFADSIVKNHTRFAENGGVFITPFPAPRILP